MNFKLIHKITAGAVFFISLITLWLTVQPSVPFWDCGEFIAAGYYLQVPHPPGTPFFLLLGRIFAMVPFDWNIAYKVNLISVFSSAFSVFFLYLIAVKLIENYKGKKPENLLDALTTYLAAAIGALSFAFSDTFWFNGVEAEVYAFSTLLVALVTWLMLRWHERADRKDNEKYLLMIAYLIGLSTGVHLMSVLAVVPVVMIIVFRKYVDDEDALKKTAYIFLGHAALILIIAMAMWSGQTSSNPPSPEEYQDYDSKFKLIIGGISVLVMGMFWKKLFNRNSFYVPLIIGGIALFTVYPGIVKFLPSIMASVVDDNIVVEILFLVVLFGALGYGVNYAIKNNKPTLHVVFMSLIFAIIGFTTFAMVIIRSNQQPPMNENEPDTFTELVSYLNREQYGDFPTFKRRFATEPHQTIVYSGYSSDLDFFWDYQMNHMMTRYWLWNYAGRTGWDQDQGVNVGFLNGMANNTIGKIFNINFSEGDPVNTFWGIPFLLGILGIYFHFRHDWKMASVFMIMFILMGYLTAFYQNQQQPQPRERDYFYVGAFFVFSIWIALGIRGLADLVKVKVTSNALRDAAVVTVLALGVVLVPIKMAAANYYTHDRSKNWIPWDYSYNLLQSCAPNAVLFTNGDNDTFPLWYLQDVEGVRRDVKIANLSLLNTSWYIKQLKNNDPYKVGTVKLRFSDDQIENIRPVQWEPRDVSVPTPRPGAGGITDVYETYNIEDSSTLSRGNITWRMDNTISFGNIKAVRVQDLMVKEIVEANNWERPIYFAVTCSEDSKIGLSDYLKMEGMAFRLVPEKSSGFTFINAELLSKQLMGNPDQTTSKDYKPGFMFRGLNNPDIFFDENHSRMTVNYRTAYLRLAAYYARGNQNDLAVKTLNHLESVIPNSVIPMDLGLYYQIGNIYQQAGADDKFNEIAAEVEDKAWKEINANPENLRSYNNPYQVLMFLYEDMKAYGKLVNLWKKIEEVLPNDPGVKSSIQKYTALAQRDNLQIDSVPRAGNDTLKQ
ncbi:MAG: DUF2723 domain-containing protein [Ignavibacteriaceae bacterium]